MRRIAENEDYVLDCIEVDVPMRAAMDCMDTTMCRSACESCPRYGTSWACPPFDCYDMAGLHPEKYEFLKLLIYRLTSRRRIGMEKARRFFDRELRNFMPALRRYAAAESGALYGFACSCDLCEDACNRTAGMPCRHPHEVCPSLEASGFVVSELLKRFADEELEWGTDGYAPRVLKYVAAIANGGQHGQGKSSDS